VGMEKGKNPMHEARQKLLLHPRCAAHCRTTKGLCKNPSMANGRCRMHGGSSTGRPATHGATTKSVISEKRQAQLALRALSSMLKYFEFKA
jgi:hypothetical protein